MDFNSLLIAAGVALVAVVVVYPSAWTTLLSILKLMLQAILGLARILLNLPFRFKFIGLWFLLLLFLLFDAPLVYGDSGGAVNHQQIVLLLYMSSLAFVFSQTRDPNPLLSLTTAEFLIWFSLAFALGAALFKILAPLTTEHVQLTTQNVAILVTHAFVVAVGEELLFRYAIPSLIPGDRLAAQAVSAVAFGAMHAYAYGLNVGNILWAMLLGLFFGVLVVKFARVGLVFAMGFHAAYNLSVLGFLSLGGHDPLNSVGALVACLVLVLGVLLARHVQKTRRSVGVVRCSS